MRIGQTHKLQPFCSFGVEFLAWKYAAAEFVLSAVQVTGKRQQWKFCTSSAEMSCNINLN